MDGKTPQELERARRVVAERLTSLYKNWILQDGIVLGPGTLAVRVEDHDRVGTNHLHIGFILNRDSAEVPVLWDCVAGFGTTSEEALDRAVETWAVSTAPVFLELLVRDGSFAEHYHGDDPEGCPGWHVIHGPVMAFGKGAAPDELQWWVLQNPILPVVGPVTASNFKGPTLNCVKLLFGFGNEDIAEVRVNGQCDERASASLRSLPWPRSRDVAFARVFFLFVHRDEPVPTKNSVLIE